MRHNRRDPNRVRKLHIAVYHLLKKGSMEFGVQSRLAEYFGVSRQRVNQVVSEERRRVSSIGRPLVIGATADPSRRAADEAWQRTPGG